MPDATPVPAPNQTWIDNDQRNRAPRYVRITAIDGDKAMCEAWYDEPGSKARTVRIRLDRFKHTSTGYRLVERGPVPADTGEAADCAFCRIAAGTAPAEIVRVWPDALAIRPRGGGVNDSHVLVIPRQHVADAGEDPAVTAAVMARAAELVAERPAANIITSKGAAATQTQFHLHVHVISRAAGDGLPLPWTPQQEANQALTKPEE